MNRKWLYHKDCPEGRIFDADDHPGDDWVDTPDKLVSEEPTPDKSVSDQPAFDSTAIVTPSDDDDHDHDHDHDDESVTKPKKAKPIK